MITSQYQGNGVQQGADINSIIASLFQGAGQNAQNPFGLAGLASMNPLASQPGLATGAGVAPQGFNLADILGTIAQGAAQVLPGLLIGLLSAQPQVQQIARQGDSAGAGVTPQSLLNFGIRTPIGNVGVGLFGNTPQFGAQTGAGVAPQGFDFTQILTQILTTVAQSAAQALPGLLMDLLSAHPQIQQIARQTGAAGGVNPQSLFNFGASTPIGNIGLGLFGNTPQLGAQAGIGVSPQGFNFADIINSVAQSAAQRLPSLLMSLLSAHPQMQQLARQGALGGVNPQGLGNMGINTPVGGAGMGLFGSMPQFGMQPGAAVSPQGIDFSAILNTVAQTAAQALPGLLMSLLSAHPQIQQLARQGGVNPQSLLNIGINTPFGGAGLGLFGNAPQFGTQQGAAVSPQGFDFASILNTVAQSAAQALPGLLMSLLSANPQIRQMAAQGIDPSQQQASRGMMH